MKIATDDANVDPNGLAACVSRAEAYPTTKLPSSPVSTSDLIGSDQVPCPMTNLDIHKRLTQISTNCLDFGRSKRRGVSLIQPNRGRRDSVTSNGSASTIISDSGVNTPEFKTRPRNAQGLRTMITSGHSQSMAGPRDGSIGESFYGIMIGHVFQIKLQDRH